MRRSPDSQPNCTKCEYYYITWDKNFPHGCRSMGFKSRELPSIAVRKNSNMNCLQFKTKKQKKLENRTYTRTKLI
ncbi:MAG: uracil-DNA glycosylase [Deltaproteobacteria bacterium]|nr:uracil-DNA glycosylase [Deltaproteobacteria bacterium]